MDSFGVRASLPVDVLVALVYQRARLRLGDVLGGRTYERGTSRCCWGAFVSLPRYIGDLLLYSSATGRLGSLRRPIILFCG